MIIDFIIKGDIRKGEKMKLKKRKLLVLALLVALVLSQSIVVLADYTGQPLVYDMSKFPTTETQYANNYYLCTYSSGADTNDNRYYTEEFRYKTYSSDSEVVLFLDRELVEKKSGHKYYTYGSLSNSDKSINTVSFHYLKGEYSYQGTSGLTYLDLEHNWMYYPSGSVPNKANGWLLYSSMKIFDSEESAQAYLDTGSLDGLIRGENKEYDLEGIYLEDFSVELHYSNYAKHIFWDFHYQIPESIEQAIAEGADCYIDLSGTYKIHTTSLSNSEAPWNIDEEVPINTVINLAEYPNGYSMNFDDVVDMKELENWFWGVGESTVNSAVTGSGSYGFNDYLCRTDTSRFDLTLIPSVNGVYGTGCSTSINLLNPKELSYWNSTPSDVSTGDYDVVSNLANSEGYYNTVVGYDNVGNPTYTYYYVNNSDNSVTNIEYKEDGSTEEVTSDGSINVNPTFNPMFNNNPTISPTIDIDIEGDNLNNEVDNIVGEGTGTKEDNESFVEKFLGFFNVFKDNDFLNVFALLFAFLPTSVSDVIVTAIGIIAGIAVFKFFRK